MQIVFLIKILHLQIFLIFQLKVRVLKLIFKSELSTKRQRHLYVYGITYSINKYVFLYKMSSAL